MNVGSLVFVYTSGRTIPGHEGASRVRPRKTIAEKRHHLRGIGNVGTDPLAPTEFRFHGASGRTGTS
jgi:hypothetical protein